MSIPSLIALRAFDAAARLGSFKAAAEHLNVSATAISHHIRGLEAQIGFALFLRETRRVALTEAGRALAEATSQAFARIEDTLNALQHFEQRLTIATTPAFAALWLAPRIQAFEAAHPELSVRVVASTERVDLGRDRSVDLALRYGPEQGVAPDAAIIGRERIQAFGAAEYVEGLRDLSEARFVSTKWMSAELAPITWSDWLKAAGEAEAKPPREREFLQEQEALQAALAGRGLVLISDILARDMVGRGWLRPYRPEIGLRGYVYAAVASPYGRDSRKARRFIAWISEQMGASPPRRAAR